MLALEVEGFSLKHLALIEFSHQDVKYTTRNPTQLLTIPKAE